MQGNGVTKVTAIQVRNAQQNTGKEYVEKGKKRKVGIEQVHEREQKRRQEQGCPTGHFSPKHAPHDNPTHHQFLSKSHQQKKHRESNSAGREKQTDSIRTEPVSNETEKPTA